MATTIDALSKDLTNAADAFGGDLAGLVKGIVSLIGQVFDELIKAIADGLEALTKKFKDKLGQAFAYVADKLGDVWQAIINILQQGMKAGFPSPLESGPGEAINAAVELSSLINTSFPTFGLADRVDVVADSFAEMIGRAGNEGDLPIFSGASIILKSLLSGLTSAGNPPTSSVAKVRQILISLLVPSKTQVVSLLKSAANGQWWGWAQLPTGFAPGKVHEWINNPASYTKIARDPSTGQVTAVTPMNAALIPIARRFRCRVVMAIDAFLRSKSLSKMAHLISVVGGP